MFPPQAAVPEPEPRERALPPACPRLELPLLRPRHSGPGGTPGVPSRARAWATRRAPAWSPEPLPLVSPGPGGARLPEPGTPALGAPRSPGRGQRGGRGGVGGHAEEPRSSDLRRRERNSRRAQPGKIPEQRRERGDPCSSYGPLGEAARVPGPGIKSSGPCPPGAGMPQVRSAPSGAMLLGLHAAAAARARGLLSGEGAFQETRTRAHFGRGPGLSPPSVLRRSL